MQLTATARESFFQNQTFLNLRCLEEPPPCSAMLRRHGAAQLVDEEPLDPLVDSIVMRLGHAQRAVVADLDQMFMRYGESQLLVDRMGRVSHTETLLNVARSG